MAPPLEVHSTSAGPALAARKAGALRGALPGGLVAVSLVTAWLLLIHNRFITPHEGWFSYYGFLIRSGLVPYRDFYFFTQPMSLLISGAIEQFGDKLIYFRYYGVGERVVLTGALYYLLSRGFSPGAAVCGTLASSFFFVAYQNDGLFTYIYPCLLFFLLALVCLQESWRNHRRRYLWIFLAGFSASLSFFTKQSNGLLAVAATGLSILFLSVSVRAAVREVAAFTAGVAAGAAPFVGWLVMAGVWNAYVKQVYFGAASTKGGMRAVFYGFLTRQITPLPVCCFLLLTAAAVLLGKNRKLLVLGPGVRPPQVSERVVLIVVIAAVVAAIITVHRVGLVPTFLMRYTSTIVSEVLMYSLLPAMVLLLWFRLGRKRADLNGNELTVTLLIAGFFWTWSCGMSWVVQEQSVIPSLALLFAFLYDRVRLGRGRAMSAIVLCATIGIVFLSAFQKWNAAFDWEGWRETVSEQGARSHWEPISDYVLDRDEAAMYDAMFGDLAHYMRKGDQIVNFPSIPLFSFVGGYRQPTFCVVEYWDVCPDEVARADALRVKSARPRMIVTLEYTEEELKRNDEAARGGRRSGQHEFYEAIESLTSSPDYRLLRSYPTPFFKKRLRLWVREK